MAAKPPAKILALDLANTTGWACGRVGGNPRFGHQRFDGNGTSRAVKYRFFRRWLRALVTALKPTLVVYEAPLQAMMVMGRTNINTLRFLMGLAEHLEEFAYRRFELREATVSQVRTHFIGKNMASEIAKPRVLKQCHDLGWMAETTDESDALALWDYQCGLLECEE